MNLPYELFLFGVAFFGFMAVVGVVQARRKKEKTYYLGAVVGFVVLLAFVFAFFNQFILSFILIVATGILSITGLPKMLRIQERELAKQLQKADLSAPLRGRDWLTWKGWFKLAYRWGIWKTVFLYWLLAVAILGGMLFTLSMYGVMSMGYVAVYTISFTIVSAIIFYRQFKKAFDRVAEGAKR